MNNLSLQVNTHVIIFNDGSKKFISEKVKNAIFENSGNLEIKEIRIDDSMIKFSSIAKILSLDDFYEQYPEQKPEPEPPKFSYSSIVDLAPQNGLREMIKGLKKYADKQPNGAPSKMLLLTMEKKYERNKSAVKGN